MKKESLNIVVVGHVDHGKSTLIGRLLFDTNSLPKEEIERVKKISEEKGKIFEYAFLLDAFEEEQKQGITIDITKLQFSTEFRDYVIIDAPGHKEFLKNMISGASQGDAALILIDCKEGVREQSRRHGFILSLLGIKNVFVVVNKMDLVSYSEEAYNSVKSEFTEFLSELGVKPKGFIPLSALNGENLVTKSENLSWYKGPTVIEAIDNLEIVKSIESQSLRLPIQDVYKFDNRRIIAGRIESGFIKKGDEVVIYPSLKESKIVSIESFGTNEEKLYGEVGESVGIILEDEFFNKRGEVIVKKSDLLKPKKGFEFTASLFWMGAEPLNKEKEYKLKLATEESLIKIKKINRVFDTSTLKNQNDSDFIKKNDVGEVVIESKTELSIDLFSEIANTGRFVLVDGYDVSGGGIIVGNKLEQEKIKSKNSEKVIREPLVTKEEREKLLGKSKIIWLRGLPGAGKNEIAIHLERKLFDIGKKTYYINSSIIEDFNKNKLEIIEREDKNKNKELATLARILLESGLTAIITSITAKEEERKEIRKILGEGNYIEIFIDTEKEICIERSNGNKLAKEYYYEKEGKMVNYIKINKKDFSIEEKAKEILELVK